jgi:hypothetical protein
VLRSPRVAELVPQFGQEMQDGGDESAAERFFQVQFEEFASDGGQDAPQEKDAQQGRRTGAECDVGDLAELITIFHEYPRGNGEW